MKSSKHSINEFLGTKNFLFYGVSLDKNKFGNSVYKHLRDNGYDVIPVHPEMKKIYEVDCVKDIKLLNEKPESAIIILSPENTDKVLNELKSYGIKKVWIQQRCESDNSENFCLRNKIDVIMGECIMMFARNVNIVHRVHKWINKVSGKLPA